MKTVIYARRSSEDSTHQILSIESQKRELSGFAEKQGLKINLVFEENKSAKQPGRPEFEKLIRLIEQYPGSIVLVWKLDRLARNPVDEGKIKWLLQNKTIGKIITPERTYCPEDNALIASVEFGMANQYIRDLSANVKRGLRTKLERGELPGPAPLGYINSPASVQKKIIDPAIAPLVKQAFEMYSTGGYSLREIKNLLHDKGLRTRGGRILGKPMLHHMFKNPFYYGTIRRKGVMYQGIHEPLISKTLFDQVQDVLTGKHHSKKQKHFFPLRGFMTCASCGCLLTASTKKGHVYYYCTNGKGNCEQHKKYLREIHADTLVAKVFDVIRFDGEEIEIAYLAAKERILNQDGSAKSQKAELAQRLKTEQGKFNNLVEVVSTDPSLKDSLKPRILALEQGIKSFEQQILKLNNQTPEQALSTLEQTKKAFLQACSASFDYLNGNDSKKFSLLKTLLWNLKLGNQNVQCFQFKQPYQLMAESPKRLELNEWWAC